MDAPATRLVLHVLPLRLESAMPGLLRSGLCARTTGAGRSRSVAATKPHCATAIKQGQVAVEVAKQRTDRDSMKSMRSVDSAMCSPSMEVRVAALAILVAGAMTTTPSSASKPPPEAIFGDGFNPALSPANDTCQTADTLTLGTQVNGTTVGASSNYDSGLETCTGFAQPGADVAYKVTLFAGQPITVTLSAPSATFDPSISLLGPGSAAAVCDAVPLTCLAGADAAGFGAGESLVFTPTSTGTYYLIVDSYYGMASRGAFKVIVTSP